ncbi:Caps the barbed end of actin filaments and is able to sever them in a calcium-dependent manner [Asimina triloba]
MGKSGRVLFVNGNVLGRNAAIKNLGNKAVESSVQNNQISSERSHLNLGTEIWRIENFQPVLLPKSEHGKFYMGDCYIVLQTSAGKGGSYLYDIHFWIGKDTSQDEAGTAAVKTVELDAVLGGRAVQHREVQGYESDKFLSYFKPCIIPLEGGVASGFKKYEEEEFETRLYVCRGKRAIRMKQVPFARSSLNHDDVFILDTEHKIYQFNGANSNIQERAKALEVIQYLKEKYHEGKCDIALIDDGKLVAESDSGEFWVLFGGFAPIGKKAASEDDVVLETTPGKLYRLGFVASENRSKFTRITRVIQGHETRAFKSNFESWPMGSASGAEDGGRGKVAAMLKQQGVDVKGMAKGAPVHEEVPPLLEGGGKIEVWRINGSAKTPVPKEDIGKFYSGDCYMILYTYHSGGDKKEDYFLCCWIGKDSIQIEIILHGGLELLCKQEEANDFRDCTTVTGAAVMKFKKSLKNNISVAKDKSKAILSSSMSYTYLMEILEALEITLKMMGGCSTEMARLHGYFCLLSNELTLFRSLTLEDQVMAAQLSNTMANSLKGRPVQGRIFQGKEPPQFIALFQPMIILKGGLSSGYKTSLEEKGLNDETYNADGVALIQVSGTSVHNNKAVQVDAEMSPQSLISRHLLHSLLVQPGVALKHAKEGTESSAFWFALGGKQSYMSKKSTQETVSEVFNFSQDDLLTEDMLILDTHAEVFIWVGHSVEPKEKQKAFEFGQNYIVLAATVEGLSLEVPLYKVTEGNEPCFFTTYFSWDSLKAAVVGNSFEKKVSLLFGTAIHSSENDRSNGQGGPTQRASALAALTSAFKPSSGSKASGPRPVSGAGQGSQRAAAVAALSSVLTAEQKAEQKKGDVTPPRTSRSPTAEGSEEFKGDSTPTVEESQEISETKETAEEGGSVSENNEEVSSPKDVSPSDENGGEITIFGYDRVKAKSTNPATGIDYMRREAYLSDAEFESVLGMTKEAFYQQPKWKQDMQKKKLSNLLIGGSVAAAHFCVDQKQ